MCISVPELLLVGRITAAAAVVVARIGADEASYRITEHKCAYKQTTHTDSTLV